MIYRVTCFDATRSCYFRKTGRQIHHKVELLQKLMNIYKHLASIKVIVLKQC